MINTIYADQIILNYIDRYLMVVLATGVLAATRNTQGAVGVDVMTLQNYSIIKIAFI